jgi:hypothetical protein
MDRARYPTGRPFRFLPTPWRFAGFLLAGTLLLAAAMEGAGRAAAEGALAVGLPADVAKAGLAVGWAVNHASREAAQSEALRRCREAREPPQATRDLCRIVESFDDECVAVALDPDAGTTGVGWAVAKTKDAAEASALEDCRQDSDGKRRAACRIALARCDGR